MILELAMAPDQVGLTTPPRRSAKTRSVGDDRTRTYIATCVIKIVKRWRAGASIFLFSAHPSPPLLGRTFAHSFTAQKLLALFFSE